MSISREGLTLLKQFEGFRPRAISLPDGRWLIGYGHTRYARSGSAVTEDQAELLLRHDLTPIIGELNTSIFAPLSQNEFDALTMFAFNAGLEAFRASGIAAHLNAGERLAAVRQMSAWNSAIIDGKPMVVDALVRRRSAEQALFLRTPNEIRPASTNLVVPLRGAVDFSAAAAHGASPQAASVTPGRGQAPETIWSPDAAPNMEPAAKPSEPPKPPSTLRTRFYDLLRARRAKDHTSPAEIDIGADVTWAGPIVLSIGAMIFLALGIYGGLILSDATAAGVARPPLALAAAFSGAIGAIACAAAALRLIAEMPRPPKGEGETKEP